MRAVILFGHGSRDPLWRVPIEAVAARITAARPGMLVTCAYLDLDEPALPAAASSLVASGATQVSIVPLFLGTGKHAREDLPRLVENLRESHPHVPFTLRPSIGEDERVLALLASIASE